MSSDDESTPLEVVNRIPPNRRLSSTGHLTIEGAKEIKNSVVELQREEGDILWTVDCKGGHFDAGIELYHTFRTSPNRIVGKVSGSARSSAFMALQGCRLRLATPSCVVQIHNPTTFKLTPIGYDTTEDEYIHAQRIVYRTYHPLTVENREVMLQILLNRSKFRSREELELFLESEIMLGPQDAIARGFLDAII